MPLYGTETSGSVVSVTEKFSSKGVPYYEDEVEFRDLKGQMITELYSDPGAISQVGPVIIIYSKANPGDFILQSSGNNKYNIFFNYLISYFFVSLVCFAGFAYFLAFIIKNKPSLGQSQSSDGFNNGH